MILKDVEFYFGGYDLTGDGNSIALDYGAEMKDATTFGNDTRINKAGLATPALSYAGLWNGGADNLDGVLFPQISPGVFTGQVITVCPENSAVGDKAFNLLTELAEYNMDGEVGELYSFSITAQGGHGQILVPGTVFATGQKTGDGNGSGQQLGSVSSAQKLYAALHVLDINGAPATLDVSIESDDNAGFTGATERGSFTQFSDVGAERISINGAITDDYWRVVWDLGASTTDATILVVLGIG